MRHTKTAYTRYDRKTSCKARQILLALQGPSPSRCEAPEEYANLRWMMVFVPAMWTIWALVVLLFAAVKLYGLMLRGGRNGQLALDGSAANVQAQQAELAAKVNKVRSAERMLLWAVCAITVFLLAYHVVSMLK